MKRIFATTILLLCLFSHFTSTASEGENKKATNPIIWADVPDVAMVRVGDTYYMSSTTMHMSPGLPIMKSKDL
ncbi:MAG: glycosyl hydrolase 43 family protein, partial [Bacteroidales bacterium]|nr:glycosyl hydrolase 43 family protein [Bacteroidales bacterium]